MANQDLQYQSDSRHSFRKDRMTDAIGMGKNSYGHTVLSSNQPDLTDEEKIQVTFDSTGSRNVNMDIFDSAVMKQYVQKNCGFTEEKAALNDESIASNPTFVSASPTVSTTPQNIEEFDAATRAYLRGEDPLSALNANIIFADETSIIPESYQPSVIIDPYSKIVVANKPATRVNNRLEESNRSCDVCYNTLLENAKFCQECGTRVPPPVQKFCTECGYNFVGQEKFCPECGNKR